MIATPDLARRYRLAGDHRLRGGDLAAAADFYRACLATDADNAEAHDGLGGVAFSLGRYALAADHFQQAVARLPASTRLLCNLGAALLYSGRLDEARETFTRAVTLDPECVVAQLNLGALALLHGDFANGWRGFEWRLGTPALRRLRHTAWEGQPLHGARILLEEEQGFGDTIHFCRYAPLVARRGGRVTLLASRQLAPLLASLPDVEIVTDAADASTAARTTFEMTWSCRLPSLPGLFGTDLSSIPADVPYLQADPARVARMRAQIAAALPTPSAPRGSASPALSVGFAWAGNPRNHHDPLRSMPLAALAPLFELEGVTPFSLQHGPPEEARRRAPNGHRLRSLESDGTTFCDAAAAIMALDLVITVDTSVAHLAGALGRPVWILLSHVPDWRWRLHTDTSPWYPTARLFRQPAADRWDVVIAQVAAELQRLQRAR